MYLIYNLLAARNNNGEGWINILFLVVAGIVWALSSISKSKKQQTNSQRKIEQPRRSIQTNSATHLRKGNAERLIENVSGQAGVIKVKQNQEISQQSSKYYDIKQLRQKYINTFKQIKDIKPVLPEITEPQIKQVPEFTTESTHKTTVAPLAPREDSPFVYIGSLLELTNTEQLKKAIIYSEILGKPLSLRDTADI